MAKSVTACSLLLFAAGALRAQPDPQRLVPLYKAEWESKRSARAAEDLGLFLAKNVSKEQAAVYLREALAIDQKSYPPKHPRIGQDLENLIEVMGEGAKPWIEQAAVNQDPSIAARNLARLSALADSREEAIAYARKSLAIEPLKKAVRMNDLALLLDPPQALPLLEQALALQKTVDPERATTQSNLANLLTVLGKLDRAEALQKQALAVFESTLGPGHPRVAAALSGLGDIARQRGRKAEARAFYLRALTIDEKAYGPNHPEVAADREALASLDRQ